MTDGIHSNSMGDKLWIKGALTIEVVSERLKEFDLSMAQNTQTDIQVNLSDVTRIDTSGVVLLNQIQTNAEKNGKSLQWIDMPGFVQETMQTFSNVHPQPVQESKPPRQYITEWLGDKLHQIGHEAVEFFYLLSDTFYFGFAGLWSHHGQRKGEFFNQNVLIGMNALPIVGLISFLIGLILALQSAAQLRMFGASIYVADLIAIAMAREMGPIMTAIVLAGRSGSAITSEIATMVVTEETDALKSMGLNPIRYVLVPKVYAITCMMPLLTILSVLFGIAGAFVIGLTYLGIGFSPFYNEVVNALVLKDIVTGLIKSVVFALLIVTIAAYFGFKVKGGAESVGRATTASVVASIFFVILADCILGLIFYFNEPIFA